MDKIKVLGNFEFFCNTGFAVVAQNIVKQLLKTDKYDFTIIGGNYFGEPYDHKEWPVIVFPGLFYTRQHLQEYNDVKGFQRVLDALSTGEFDILFTIYDPTNIATFGEAVKATQAELKKQGRKVFKWVYYFPVENYVRKHWVDNAIGLADYPVAYTEYGKKEVIKVDPSVKVGIIYHGINLKEFYPLDKETIESNKKTIFGGAFKDKYVVSNINRNVRRKDLPRTLLAFKEFKKSVPNAILYLHSRYNDMGGDFRVMANDIGLKEFEDYIHPINITEDGYPIEAIYNVSDLIITTTLGEGWGLSISEAMATKTPVVAPNNTSLTEIIGDDRGFLCDCKEKINLGPDDWNLYRPIVDIDDMVSRMIEAHDGGIDFYINNAYEWIKKLSWEKICVKWDELLTRASESGKVIEKVNRNDECPACKLQGKSVKWKKCRIHNS
jgi:D-inositol-3-phosphate glycosyltransferase